MQQRSSRFTHSRILLDFLARAATQTTETTVVTRAATGARASPEPLRVPATDDAQVDAAGAQQRADDDGEPSDEGEAHQLLAFEVREVNVFQQRLDFTWFRLVLFVFTRVDLVHDSVCVVLNILVVHSWDEVSCVLFFSFLSLA